MSRQKRIRYGIDDGTGYVVSQNMQTGQIAFPMIDFGDMGPSDAFAIHAHLESAPAYEYLGACHTSVTWTRKIPTAMKNRHRAFWEMPALSH